MDNHPHMILKAHGIQASLSFSIKISGFDTQELLLKQLEPDRWHGEGHGVELFVEMKKPFKNGWILDGTIRNTGSSSICVKEFKLGSPILTWDNVLEKPHALHALHSRTGTEASNGPDAYGSPPLLPLAWQKRHELTKRSPHTPHFEGLVLWTDWEQPCVVEGPLTQNVAHQEKSLTWVDEHTVRIDANNTFVGLEGRVLEPGETLHEASFVQIRIDGTLNTAFEDYLAALQMKRNGDRGTENPLRREIFFCTWNNFAYWEINEVEVLETARLLTEKLPQVSWYCIDDGYQASSVNPQLQRTVDGKRQYDLDTELKWYDNCPGITFAFDDGCGVNREKFPGGLEQTARKLKELGLRPAMWIGMEVSRDAPIVSKHSDWFIEFGHQSHVLPDISLPAVRGQIENVFKLCFQQWGFEGVKIDFYSNLFDNPKIRYQNPERSGAELKRWFFGTLRKYLPSNGFITVGTEVAMGAPWLASWVDSYRHSHDARDGSWNTILGNIRWSVVPQLTGNAGQPVPDADTISVLNDVNREQLAGWANYAMITGTLLEVGGDLRHWSNEDFDWLRPYLSLEERNEQIHYGDSEFWTSTGLPSVVFRRRTTAQQGDAWLLCLFNWSDEEIQIKAESWLPLLQSSGDVLDSRTKIRLDPAEVNNITLSAHGSRLLEIAAKPAFNNRASLPNISPDVTNPSEADV